MNEQIIDTKYEDEQYLFVIDGVNSVTGDCDVTQRKGKVLCIYDMKLVFSIDSKSKDGESVKSTVTIPEFVHDQDDDEYVFELDSAEHRAEIRKLLVPLLKKKLQEFQTDLISAHEKDVQHQTN